MTGGSHVAYVEPAGLRIEVLEGETLFDAAYRAGYDWPTICGGQARCTHCHVRLVDGEAGVSPVATENERRLIRRLAQRLYDGEPARVRLACQLELHADVTVEQVTFRGERLPE